MRSSIVLVLAACQLPSTDDSEKLVGSGSTVSLTTPTTPPAPGVPPELVTPAQGEWPMFKRTLDHRGVADGYTGDFNGRACVMWEQRVTGDGTRGCSGAVVGAVDGAPTVFVAVDGWCSDDGTECESGFDPVNYLSIPGVPGKVWAIDGASGDVRWSWRADDDLAQFDPYGALLVDLDRDGARELVVPSTNSRWIYAFDAGNGRDGWKWRADLGDKRKSEGAPAAADLDGDGRLEVLLGDDADETDDGDRAAFHAFDSSGVEISRIEVENRGDLPSGAGCGGLGRKIDSSQPAVVVLDNEPVILTGAWDGSFWAFHWEDQLMERWRSRLPDRPGADCPVAKVRSSAAIADLDGDGQSEVVFGSMYEETEGGTETADAVLRVLDLTSGDPVADEVRGDWKSSPSLGDLDPGGDVEVAGGWTGGIYEARADLSEHWNRDLPAGLLVNGNRSSPALADLDNDGDLDVVIGLEGDFGPDDPAVVALDGRTGDTLWEVAYDDDSSGTCSSPAVADVDGDGTLDVVVLGRDGVLRAIGRCDP